jgi:hypothetical protein
MHKTIVALLLLGLSFIFSPVFCQTVSPENPVVIRHGDVELTRRQLELEFELQMVIDAVLNGVPIKDQQQIMTMQYQFLEKRAHEIVLLDMAEQRGISHTNNQLMSELNRLMGDLGFDGYNRRNLAKLGIEDEQLLHNYVANNIRMTSLITQLEKELELDENSMTLDGFILEQYQKSRIVTFPEQLRSPLSRRYQ